MPVGEGCVGAIGLLDGADAGDRAGLLAVVEQRGAGRGAGWDGEFSVGWGIDSIPSLFVVDKNGCLASLEARGQLETLLPELLAAE